ncbi:MAG: hypothetical protein EHM20_13895 [Alphaproteobacteria bacterium]|nr:MAG: hypothetical protein EHM20_13895 [Alphaproteobacteria bacterium]
MLENKLLNYAFIFIFIFERLIELYVNRFNKAFMVNKYFAKVKYPDEALQMRLFHTIWFIALIAETYFSGVLMTGFWFYFCVAVLILAQVVRWYAIYTLGPFWSVDVYEVNHHPIIKKGPYAYVKHPNYYAVLTEFIVLPLLLGCYSTLIVGTIFNMIILKRRIQLEEDALRQQGQVQF